MGFRVEFGDDLGRHTCLMVYRLRDVAENPQLRNYIVD